MKAKDFKGNLEILAQFYEWEENAQHAVNNFVERVGYDAAKETLDMLHRDDIYSKFVSLIAGDPDWAEAMEKLKGYNGTETAEIHESCTAFAERIGSENLVNLPIYFLSYERQIQGQGIWGIQQGAERTTVLADDFELE